jgi:hypothetical protein
MFDTIEQIVYYDTVISSTVALTGASSAMCGLIGSTQNTSGTVNAVNAVATLAGVGGSVLIGNQIIREHLGGNKDLNKLYGLMAVPVIAVGAVRLASSFIDNTGSSNSLIVENNHEEDLSDKIAVVIDIFEAVKDIHELKSTNDKESIINALDVLSEQVDDDEDIETVIDEFKTQTLTSDEMINKAKIVAKDTAKEAIIILLEDIDEYDESKTKTIKDSVTALETKFNDVKEGDVVVEEGDVVEECDVVEEFDWANAIAELNKALDLADEF